MLSRYLNGREYGDCLIWPQISNFHGLSINSCPQTTYALGYCLLFANLELPHLSSMGNVGSPAKLFGKGALQGVAGVIYLHFGWILAFEEIERPALLGFIERHLLILEG